MPRRVRWTKTKHSDDFSLLDTWFGLLAFFIPCLSSLSWLGNDLPTGLSGEFIVAGTTWGLSHFPGVPLYIVTLNLFTHLWPWGTPIASAYLLSLLSTCLAGYFFFASSRKLHFPPWVSLLAALLFFYSPWVWPYALLVSPHAFHLMLLMACLHATLKLFHADPWSFPTWSMLGWSLVCGLLAGQEIIYLPWILLLFGFGLLLAMPRHHARQNHYLQALAGFTLGAMLPYLYIIVRSYMVGYGPLGTAGHPLLSIRQHALWWLHYYQLDWNQACLETSFRHYLDLFKVFFRNYPFLASFITVLGFLLSLRKLFIKTPGRTLIEGMPDLRLSMLILSFLALLNGFWLLPKDPQPIFIGFTLAAGYWGLWGMEYCYARLGHSDAAWSKAQRLHPTLLGILVLLLLPVLAFLQTFPWVKSHYHLASAPRSTMQQARHCLTLLPNRAQVFLPTPNQFWPLLYVKQIAQLRPDIALLPNFSIGKLSRPSGTTATAGSSEVTDAWSKKIHEKVTAGLPVLISLPAQTLYPTIQFLLDNFQLHPFGDPFGEWSPLLGYQYYTLYQLTERSLNLATEKRPLPAASVANFNRQLLLLSAHMEKTIGYPQQFNLLPLQLNWQIYDPEQLAPCTVRFQIKPYSLLATDTPAIWESTRPLSSLRLLAQMDPLTCFSEYYQLPAPLLTPGRYQLLISIQNAKHGLGLPYAKQPNGESLYFVPICELWVLLPAATDTARSTTP